MIPRQPTEFLVLGKGDFWLTRVNAGYVLFFIIIIITLTFPHVNELSILKKLWEKEIDRVHARQDGGQLSF